jgi:hypothetical protein
MLRKGKEPKRKSIAATLLQDMQGTAAEKLDMFEKVRAAGGFANEHPADVAETEKMLREFAAMEKGSGWEGTRMRLFEAGVIVIVMTSFTRSGTEVSKSEIVPLTPFLSIL